MTPKLVIALKVAVALAGLMVLLPGARRRDTAGPTTARRLRDGGLLALGILAGVLWWNGGKFRFDGYLHPWDAYHYYVGAKYFRELGYTRLYLCSTVADLEDGAFPSTHARYVRDLETNLVRRMPAILVDASTCLAHFTPERWTSFKQDVAWFRHRLGTKSWERALRDHGYNGTPAWAILGTTLAHTGRASDTQILLLSLIDPLLLLAMWVAVGWAFGWRALCATLLFWGTNYPANFGWTGGSYLRQDWLAASVIGICLLRAGVPLGAGFALTTAALLRVFPGLLIAGLLLKAGWEMWAKRRLWLSPELRRFTVGGLTALVVLLPLSTLIAGREDAWPEFVANTAKHRNTPLTNYMGWRTLVSYDHDTRAAVVTAERLEDDPFAVWKAARQRVFAARWPIFAAAVVGFVLLLAWAVRAQPYWAAAVLGIGLIPFVAELTCYYYAVLLAYGLLWQRHPHIAASLSLLAAATWLGPALFSPSDQIYTLLSGLVLAFVVFATLSAGKGETENDEHRMLLTR